MIDLNTIVQKYTKESERAISKAFNEKGGMVLAEILALCVAHSTFCLKDYHEALQQELKKHGIEI